jgi:hypothetical protein
MPIIKGLMPRFLKKGNFEIKVAQIEKRATNSMPLSLFFELSLKIYIVNAPFLKI